VGDDDDDDDDDDLFGGRARKPFAIDWGDNYITLN
jgi:hypothetical protein